MSPKAKNKSFPPVKVTERFLEETTKCAELSGEDGETISEYIRKAVQLRNATVKFNHKVEFDSIHKNNRITIN